MEPNIQKQIKYKKRELIQLIDCMLVIQCWDTRKNSLVHQYRLHHQLIINKSISTKQCFSSARCRPTWIRIFYNHIYVLNLSLCSKSASSKRQAQPISRPMFCRRNTRYGLPVFTRFISGSWRKKEYESWTELLHGYRKEQVLTNGGTRIRKIQPNWHKLGVSVESLIICMCFVSL